MTARSGISYIGIALLCAFASCSPADPVDSPDLLPVPDFEIQRFEPGVRDAIGEALETIESQKSSPPDTRAVGYGRLGMLLQAHDLTDLAEPCYLNARTLAPGHYQWPYLLAYLYQLDGRLDEAVSFYRTALEIRPGFLPALLHLGQALNSLERYDEATRAFESAREQEPHNAVALEGLGNIAYRNGDYAEAIQLFSDALTSDPEATRLNYTLGMSYRKLGDLDKAREFLAKRGTRNPALADPAVAAMKAMISTSQHHIKKGLEAYESGRFQVAREEYRAAVAAEPSDLDTRLALAWVLELEGNDEQALTEVEFVIDQDPQSAKAHYLKGALLAREDRNREAAAHLVRAVELDPGSPTPRLVLATTLMRSGAYPEAEAHYARLAEMMTEDVILLYRLGVARLASGKCDQAIEPLETALRICSGSLTVIQALLRAYSICPRDSKGDRQTALVQAQRIFDQIQRWDSAETLAMALAANERYAEAAELQKSVIAAARASGQSLTTLAALSDNLARYEANMPAESAWPAGAEVFQPPALSAQDRYQLDG